MLNTILVGSNETFENYINIYNHKDLFNEDLYNCKNILTGHFNIIVIHNADKLQRHLQFLLRTIMERNYINCRFIFLTPRVNSIIEPLKSRCIIKFCKK